jgi:hypothetical protein
MRIWADQDSFALTSFLMSSGTRTSIAFSMVHPFSAALLSKPVGLQTFSLQLLIDNSIRNFEVSDARKTMFARLPSSGLRTSIPVRRAVVDTSCIHGVIGIVFAYSGYVIVNARMV